MAALGTYITVADAAERLGISTMTAYRLIGAGDMPAVRVGGQIRIPVEELRAWLEDTHTGWAET